MKPLPSPFTEPTGERVRLTIAVTPEVHAAFTRLAAASGVSLSRSMGDWLHDTLEAVEYTAGLMEKARSAPKMVMREVHAYALGLADETGALMEKLRQEGRRRPSGALPEARPDGSAPIPPRPVIRGGKSQKRGGKP
jgi:hypothetical protein